MSRFTLKFSLLALFFIPITSCFDNVNNAQLEAVTKQLEKTYSACKNEGIDDPNSLADVLNAGGNNLSKSCRTALGAIDFQALIDELDISLDFELPKPSLDINPLRDNDASWFTFANSMSVDKSLFISTGLDSVAAGDISVQGITDAGLAKTITGYSTRSLMASDVAVSYTTDYSGSMLKSDIVAVSGYFNDLYPVFPSGAETQVAIFSDDVKKVTAGFISDATTIANAFDFDGSYPRASTSLYDAWGDAITQLEATNASLALNIMTTDGFENNSSRYAKQMLIDKIKNSNVFNIIIASSWAEPNKLKNIIGDKGVVIFKYQIDEAQSVIKDIETMLSNVKVVDVTDDLTDISSLNLILGSSTKMSVSLP